MADPWHPDEWLARLSAALEVVGTGYQRVPLEEEEVLPHTHWPARRANRTTFAAMTVGAVQNALRELPGIADSPGMAPLHDLIAALLDLGHGGQPPLLQPARGVGKGVESSARRIVRQHAIAFVGLLEKTGTKATAACREVAPMLARSGHKGFKGDLITESTVKGWWSAARRRDYAQRDPYGAAAYRRFFENVEMHPDWPFSPQSARKFIQDIIDSPAMRSKVG